MRGFLKWLAGALLLTVILAGVVYEPIPVAGFEGLPYADLLVRVLNLLLVCAGLCLLRVLLGPSAADRIVAVDILGILIVSVCAVFALVSGRSWYLDIGIVWALQSFIGSLALAKRLEGRTFDD
jgi:multicomponent Na+:H+ antiporter subunit F